MGFFFTLRVFGVILSFNWRFLGLQFVSFMLCLLLHARDNVVFDINLERSNGVTEFFTKPKHTLSVASNAEFYPFG